VAACPSCRREHAQRFSKATHRAAGCETFAADWAAECAKREALKAAGHFVRFSALTTQGGLVHVLFAGSGDTVLGRFMEPATYDAVPLRDAATVEDYERVGWVTDAPARYVTGGRLA